MKKKILLGILLGVLLASGTSFADFIPIYVGQTINVNESPSVAPRGNDGGPFLVTGPVPSSGTPFSFFTFCVEKDEYLSLGSNYYIADISHTVIGGGLDNSPPTPPQTPNPNNPSGSNVLSYQAAAIYNQWLGLSDNAKLSAATNAAYQNAIWYAEGEITSITGDALTIYNNNAGATSYGGVYVLNLTDGPNGALKQSLLVKDPVPEPISMLLFGTGLAGIGGYVRRKLKA